jgi:hypothetical protein
LFPGDIVSSEAYGIWESGGLTYVAGTALDVVAFRRLAVLWTLDLRTCRADFDGDGFLTFEDFDAFVGAFEAGDASADFDGDGFLSFEDFDAFVGAFEAGC